MLRSVRLRSVSSRPSGRSNAFGGLSSLGGLAWVHVQGVLMFRSLGIAGSAPKNGTRGIVTQIPLINPGLDAEEHQTQR
jgi:hypothetical protein